MDANRFLTVCLALLVWTLSTTASAGTVTDTVMDSNNKEKVTIQLKWFHQFQFAGYYAAIEKGFYAEEGLEVELLQHVSSSNHINNVLRGGAQYGVSNAGLLLERMRGKPVVLLAQIFQHSPLVFLSREDSGIRTPEDLAGKRVTFNVGGYRHMPLIALLQSTPGGLDAARVEAFSFNYHDLIDGKSEAVPAYITDQPYWFRQRDVAVNIIDPRDYGIDFYGDNLFTTEQELSEHPERVKKIRRASLKGWQYALNNPEEIIDLILEKYNPQGLSRDHLAYEARETKNLIIPDFVEIGSFNPTRYQKTADIYARSGFVEQTTLDPGFFYQMKTLPKQIDLTTEEKAWLEENPVIHLGNSVDWSPFGFINDEGVYSGIAADYMKVIEGLLGIRIKPSKLETWKETVDAARKGEVDLLDAVVPTLQRRKFLTFTKPYISYPIVLFAHRHINYIANMSDLNGQRVSVIEGSALHDILINNHPDIEIVPAKNARVGLVAVEKGEASVFIGNLPTASRVISREGLINLKVAGETPYRYDLTIGVNKSKPILASLLQKALDGISEERHNTIYHKWLSVTFDHKPDYTLLWQVLAIGIFILAIFIYWNHRLRLEVKYRHRAEEALKNSNIELEIQVKQRTHSLGERVKELNCLYRVEKLAGYENASLEEMIQATADLIPPAYQYPEITCACIVFKDREFKSEDFEATEWGQLAEIKVDGNKIGEVRAYYKEEKHDIDEGPFLKEERSMIDNIARRLGLLAERKKAEEALAQSETLYHSLVENMNEGMGMIDENGIFTYANDQISKILGCSVSEIIGEHWMSFYDEGAQKVIQEQLKKRVKGGSDSYEVENTRKDGKKVWINVSPKPIYDEDGNVKGSMGLVQDITERKHAEEELHKHKNHLEDLVQQRTKELSKANELLANVFASTHVMLAYMDCDFNFIHVNKAYAEADGHSIDYFTGKNHFALYPDEENEAVFRRVVDTGTPYSVDAKAFEYPDNPERGVSYWDWNLQPVMGESDNVEAVVLTLIDVTEQKYMQTYIIQAKEAAETANQAKNTFLSNMSHELRTPLNAILGFSQLLLRDQTIHSKQQNQIKIIKRSGENLLEHISDILDLASIETNKIELTSTSSNIATFIHYICNYFKTSIEEKGIELICEASSDTPSIVGIDEKRLQQILLNLVGNAVKFTDHGKVVLRVEPCELASSESDNQRCLRFKVQDTGVGISPESYEQIFEPFVQLKRPNQITEGTGLGLSIAQQLVGLMGGELKVESEVGVGSCFWFDLMLPVSEELEITRAKPEHMPAGYRGKERTILVVDDIADNRAVLRDLLQSMRFKVLLAQSGDEAITLMRGPQPDLILMDLLMPAMDGYMALSILREIFGTTEIPVVAVSASVSEEESALSAGFDGFIPKPTPSDALVDVLGDLLKLEWIESVDETTDEDDLVYPPDEELEPLGEWIQLGKMRQIIKWAEELMSRVPEYTDFAQRVIMLAKDVDEEGLRVLIGKN